jgi:hypothetical protein
MFRVSREHTGRGLLGASSRSAGGIEAGQLQAWSPIRRSRVKRPTSAFAALLHRLNLRLDLDLPQPLIKTVL